MIKIPHASKAWPFIPKLLKKLVLKSGIGRSASLAIEIKGNAIKIKKDINFFIKM